LKGTKAVGRAGTGPVGQRVARLPARQGAEVRIASRQQARAAATGQAIRATVTGAQVEAVATGTAEELAKALAGRTLALAAGAAGAVLLPKSAPRSGLRVAIDLNAVPPLGIEGLEVSDKGKERDGLVCYGAIGVGDTKM